MTLKIRDWDRIVSMMEQGFTKQQLKDYRDDTYCKLCKEFPSFACKNEIGIPCPIRKANGRCDYADDSWWEMFSDWMYNTHSDRRKALRAAKKIRDCINEYYKKKKE